LFIRLNMKWPTTVVGITSTRKQNKDTMLLNLPFDALLTIISHLHEDTSAVTAVLLVCVDLHSITFKHVRNTLHRTQWSAGITLRKCVATELALCVVHFLTRFRMHSFSTEVQYNPIKRAIMAKHSRVGLMYTLEITRDDPHEPQEEWEPFLENRTSNDGDFTSPIRGVNTSCPFENVQICCIDERIAVLVDNTPVLVTKYANPVRNKTAVPCWMGNGQISVLCWGGENAHNFACTHDGLSP